MYEDKCILGKTIKNGNLFNSILFAQPDIEFASIPSFISHLSHYAFYKCENLKKIEFPLNSKLETIEKNAFGHLLIEKVSFPLSVIKIGENAFFSIHESQKS